MDKPSYFHVELLSLYRAGKFPMGDSADDPQLYIVDPPNRAILPVGGVHASRSLLRSLQRDDWSATIDTSFPEVVSECAGRAETWINQTLRQFYMEMFSQGNAHSFEVWKNGRLAGCLFGIQQGRAFFAESMASPQTDGSKMALLWLNWFLAKQEFKVCDVQFLTPHLQRMGAIEIPRHQYREMLIDALSTKPKPIGTQLPSALELWHEMTQTS